MSFRHLLLDADGVLQHRPGGWESVLAPYTADHAALFGDLVIEEAPSVRGAGPFLPVLERVLADRGVLVDARRVYAEVWGQVRTHQPVLDLVAELRGQGVGVHLASNQHPERARWMRRTLGYEAAFDSCFFSCEVGAAKPGEDYFRRVLADIGAEPDDVLLVDDSSGNTRAARALGIRAVTWHHRQGVARLRRQLAGHC